MILQRLDFEHVTSVPLNMHGGQGYKIAGLVRQRVGSAAFQAAIIVPNSSHFHFKERAFKIFLSRCKRTVITKFNNF